MSCHFESKTPFFLTADLINFPRSLRYLNLRFIDMNDATVATITSQCPNLITLILYSSCKFGHIRLSQFAHSLPQLENLSLSYFKVKGKVTASASSSTSLASDAAINGHGSNPLKIGLKNLLTLDLEGWGESQLRDADLVAFLSRCPKLVFINLSGLSLVGDATAVSLANSCPNTTELILSGTAVGDYGLYVIESKLKKLRHLAFDRCVKICNAGFALLEKRKTVSSSLQNIILRCCRNVDDTCVIPLANSCPNIRCLVLSETNVSDEGLFAIASKCTQLQSLHLEICRDITDEGVIAISKKCKKLEQIFLCDSMQVGDEAVIALVKNCPEMHSIFLNLWDFENRPVAMNYGKYLCLCDNEALLKEDKKDCVQISEECLAAIYKLRPNTEYELCD